MPIAFFVVLCVLAHYLAGRWVLSTFARPSRRVQRIVWGTVVVFAVLPGGARIMNMWGERPRSHFVFAIVAIELATLLIVLLPIGILTGVLRIAERVQKKPVAVPTDRPVVSRRQIVERVAGGALVAATGSALGWGIVRGRHAFAQEEVIVRVAGWPKALEGYTIAQVSDIHVGTFVGDRELDEGFELVQRVRPDLVVATGDLVDADAGLVGALLQRLARVNARDGAFTILGNHDHYAGAADVVARIRASGIRALCNESVILRPGDGGGFALLGVDDLSGRTRPSPGFTGPDLSAALRSVRPDQPKILLAHQPKYLHESSGRVALQLSGHTHGGQINPGFRPADFVMEYVSGRYERDGTTLWVNRGFGVAGPPSRVNAPPEVTKIVIVGA